LNVDACLPAIIVDVHSKKQKSMKDKFEDKYRIPSARVDWTNYNQGLFFVTICTCNQVHYLGDFQFSTFPDEPHVCLSKIGLFVEQNLKNVKEHYPYAEIPLFVIIPNHIHAIIDVDFKGNSLVNDFSIKEDFDERKRMQMISNKKGKLSVVVGGLKSAVTRYANTNKLNFAWQPRFYDHVIRDHFELNRCAEYIDNNISNWNSDANKRKHL